MATVRPFRSPQRAPPTALLLAGAALGALSWAACGSDGNGAGAGGAGAGASASGGTTTISTTSSTATGGSSSSSSGGGEGGCAPEPLPAGVSDDWAEYTDWSCDCRFYVPGSVAALPAPIAWESCPDVGDSVDCRMMVVDWTDQHTAVAVNPTMELGSDGEVLLAFSRSSAEGNLYMVAEADGGTYSGIFWPHGSVPDVGCWLSDQGMNEGMRVFSVKGNSLKGPMTKHQGALGGPIDELHPKLLAKYINEDDPYKDAWRAGASWLLQYTWPLVVKAHRWDMSSTLEVHSPIIDPEGMKANQLQVVGEAVFFTTMTTQRASRSPSTRAACAT